MHGQLNYLLNHTLITLPDISVKISMDFYLKHVRFFDLYYITRLYYQTNFVDDYGYYMFVLQNYVVKR